MKKSLSKKSSNDLILDGKYDEAIALLRKELKQSPDSHWCWTQLSSAYYEKRKYRLAVRYAERAIGIMPNCPNALWHYAGALVWFNVQEAYKVFRGLLKKGIRNLDRMKCCNEGHKYNLALLNDSRMGLALCSVLLKNYKDSARWFRLFVKYHNSECIYTIKEAKQMLEKINGKIK